jgi:hypothetical protein
MHGCQRDARPNHASTPGIFEKTKTKKKHKIKQGLWGTHKQQGDITSLLTKI